MNILVTGAAGYIGARIVEVFCQKDWVIIVLGENRDAHENRRFHFVQCLFPFP